MHIDFTVNLGTLVTLLTVVGIGLRGLWWMHKIDLQLGRLFWEHDMIWEDFKKTHDLNGKTYNPKRASKSGV